ncbi:MAG: hypothetical protein MRJ96_03925 [Nitrospirales bacterium]|nr:hypothetical protein [Nitrospira sp.]MDR4500587.1 hypothetical protein [Nitrospirales bacterium]
MKRSIAYTKGILGAILAILTVFSVVVGAETVDDLQNLTTGVVPSISYKEHDPFSSGQLTSVSHIEYVVRVKNQTGDPIVGESLVLVVEKIIELSGHDVSDRIQISGADGYTSSGRPYFHIPVGDKKDLDPFEESEPITIALDNPDYLRFFPPTLQVRGEPRVSSKSVKGLLDTLVNKGLLTPSEAAEALESPTKADP